MVSASVKSYDNIAWDIICLLYPDEEQHATMIANSIGEYKSTVNSVLYNRRNLFSMRTTNYSARPLWSLSEDSIRGYETIYASVDDKKTQPITPLFCLECGMLPPTHTPVCSLSKPTGFKLKVDSRVNFGGELGLPGYFGIRYSHIDSEVATKNRRDDLIEFLITEFIPVESNAVYVRSYDEPRTPERRDALVNHLQGINVPASSTIRDLRNEDITWLLDLDLDQDLP